MSIQLYECGVLGCETKHPIECQHCKYISCIKCTQTFILSQTKAECMNCHKEYDETYLRKQFPKGWIAKDYTKWKKDKLIEKEKGFLPETVGYLESEKNKLVVAKYIFTLKQKELQCKEDILQAKHALKVKKLQAKKDTSQLNPITTRLNELSIQLDIIRSQIEVLTGSIASSTNYMNPRDNPWRYNTKTLEELLKRGQDLVTGEKTVHEESKEIERRIFVKPCPAEDCRGFLSIKWKCGLCNTKVCKDCHEIIHVPEKKEKLSDSDSEEEEEKYPTHVCDQNNLETAKALQKETKGCPKCGVRIYKVSGCSQIWCVSCHTAFSWETGKIETGTIHNPHYFEYLRKNNLTIARYDHPDANGNINLRCGEVPSFGHIQHHVREKKNGITFPDDFPMRSFLESISECIRFRNHVEIYNNRGPLREINHTQESNRDLRIRYLLKEIDEKNWIQTVMRRYKKIEYNRVIHNLNETLRAIFGDLLINILTLSNLLITREHLMPFVRFLDYYNKESDIACKQFGYNVNEYFIPVTSNNGTIRRLDWSKESLPPTPKKKTTPKQEHDIDTDSDTD